MGLGLGLLCGNTELLVRTEKTGKFLFLEHFLFLKNVNANNFTGNTVFNIYFSKSTDGGSTWSAPAVLFTETDGENPSIIANGSNFITVWESIV
jgi:hypothetical protein